MRANTSTNSADIVSASALKGLLKPVTPTRSLSNVVRITSLSLILYWLAIFIGTHMPADALPRLGSSDKVLHAIAFSGLAFLLACAIPTHGQRVRHLLIVAAIAIGYGCLDEFTQQFVPGRRCDVWDIAADATGVAIGLMAYLLVRSLLMQLAWGRKLVQGISL